ncbi:hypothetical protein GCM10010435_32250 [Winogradskya consettensis]|uniref:Glycosyltransferase RgtA/B/C/D-like domain-containing protein n=1 Tax=Winogradskya consettensis TaxID=113560 RepID=A0A919VNM2_9ACTN|nr:glycosyltransferase family 39 protein [Actinoplanes consettensis]GIM70242.1 hypothetical protein Aco04nite_19240 [Actinoplanes consettensis]
MISALRAAPVRRVLPALIPGLTMLVLGLLGATRSVLSWDEIASVDVARRSVPQIWDLINNVDGVFGPYYMFLHFWDAVFGQTVLTVRVPSILAMAAAAAVTGELGRRLFSPLAGVVGGLILCSIPNISRYASEARPYAFAVFVAALSLLLLLMALDKPGWVRWLAYAISVVGLGVAQLIALTAVGAHFFVVLMRLWKPERTPVDLDDERDGKSWSSRKLFLWWAGAAAVGAACIAPIVIMGSGQHDTQLTWVPPLTVKAVRYMPTGLTGQAEIAWLIIGLAVTAAWFRARNVAVVALAALVPLVVVCLVSWHGPSFWVARYVLFVLPFAALLAGVGLVRALPEARTLPESGALPEARTLPETRPWGRYTRIAAVLVLIAALVYPAQWEVRGKTVKNGTDYRTAAKIIKKRQEPGDGLLFSPGNRILRPGVYYYLADAPYTPKDLLIRKDAADVDSLYAAEWPGTPDRVESATRLWLFTNKAKGDPLELRTDLRDLLTEDYTRTQIWRMKEGTLALYTPKSSS